MLSHLLRYPLYFLASVFIGAVLVIGIALLSVVLWGNQALVYFQQLTEVSTRLYSHQISGLPHNTLFELCINQYSLAISSFFAHIKHQLIVQKGWVGLIPYIESTGFAFQWVIIRCGWIVLSLPLWLGLGILAIVDGAVQRLKRRAVGDRESAHRYQKSRLGIVISLIGGVVLFMLLPFNFSPAVFLWVLVGLFAYFVQRTVCAYKKYS
jgi:hypothetical protein